MLKFLIAAVVLAHGVGHILFLIPLLGIADWGQSSESWLLGGGTVAKLIGGLFWLVSIVGFTAAVLGMLGQQDWWRTVAILSSAVSLVGLLLFWKNPASSSAFFASVFDLVVPLTLLIAHWPSIEVIGA